MWYLFRMAKKTNITIDEVSSKDSKEFVPPKGSSTALKWRNSSGKSIAVMAQSDWMILRKKEGLL